MRLHHEIEQGIHYFPESVEMLGGPMQLQINFFAVVGSKKSILIDTGMARQSEESIAALSKVIDPASLDYIFLSHLDAEHMGGVKELLKIAPKARIVGNMPVFGQGTTIHQFPRERCTVVFPGEEIDLGDRTLRVLDSLIEDGHTSWLLDSYSHTLFSSDAFGSVHLGPVNYFAENVPAEAFVRGFVMWQAMSFNMLPKVDVTQFRQEVEAMQNLDIQQIASVHGPIIRQEVKSAFELLNTLPTAELPPPPPLPDFLRVFAA